ncbi:MAG: diaminopimelate decarboxylase [Rhodothermales bacterium]|nr:diaminopimelate decarboxylase [Rhodothermales bacterium]
MPLPCPPDALRLMAERFGTPTYVYHAPTLRRQAARMHAMLDGVDADVLYAVKANACPAVVAVLRDAGCGIDAVSPAELLLGLRLGVDPAKMQFSPSMPAPHEADEAVNAGVLVNLGDLSALDAFGQRHPGADVSLRLNPGHGAGHHAHVVTAGEGVKFGLKPAEFAEALTLVDRHSLRLVGLHMHVGSGLLDASDLVAPLDVLLDLARTLPDVRVVNVGGGLGQPYRPGEPDYDDDHYRSVVTTRLAAFAQERPGVRFRVEPGRFLVAQAGVLLASVTVVKDAAVPFVGTDTGMNHLIRPALYDAYHEIVNLSRPDAPERAVTVTGNACESADVFATARPLPMPVEGDVLAIADAGAYGASMASPYNLRPFPAEVLLDDAGPTLVRERLSDEAFVAVWLAGTPYALTAGA